jgi:exopolysaccharide production protein ExoZ
MQYSIQYLRAVAATMVVVFHCFFSVSFMRPDIGYFSWLRSGVDIFFIVSGYVMVTSTMGRSVDVATFALRRINRIVPLYWLATTIMAFSVLPGEYLYKIGSMLFLPVTHPGSGLIEPIVQPGWTLNYEMFFYALFAMTLTMRERWRFPAMSAILTMLVFVGTMMDATGVASFYSGSIILEFAFGMAIARFGLVAHWLFIPVGLAVLACFHETAAPRALTMGVPAAFIVAGFLSLEHRLPRWQSLRLVGDASYAVYLFHIMALAMFVPVWLSLELSRLWFVPAATIAILATGTAIHIYAEKPLLSFTARIAERYSNYGKFRRTSLAPTAQ